MMAPPNQAAEQTDGSDFQYASDQPERSGCGAVEDAQSEDGFNDRRASSNLAANCAGSRRLSAAEVKRILRRAGRER